MKNETKNLFSVIVLVLGVIGVIALVANNGKGASADSHDMAAPAQADAASLEAMVGKPAPQFSLTDINGKEYTAESLKGKNVVLFFNEGLMCYPACWNQIAQFGSDDRFNTADTVALSVVVDPKAEWGRAIEKMPELAAATTLFDEGATVSRAFNVLTTASSMHYGALPGHTYVIIDKAGIVRDVLDDPRMAIRNDEIFTKIQALQ